ncbi:conserved hypothetical protein [Ricinus communis]|uniref:Uncharacterized protein n=1 Tax=Ricinus communis TaxID=3988 RepID=B9RH76_RICCO|nr:conserved hypothetical protein [Ricinus communis]
MSESKVQATCVSGVLEMIFLETISTPYSVSETGFPLNKGNIYLPKTGPSTVFKVNLKLFERDFTMFLRSRSAGMILGVPTAHPVDSMPWQKIILDY